MKLKGNKIDGQMTLNLSYTIEDKFENTKEIKKSRTSTAKPIRRKTNTNTAKNRVDKELYQNACHLLQERHYINTGILINHFRICAMNALEIRAALLKEGKITENGREVSGVKPKWKK